MTTTTTKSLSFALRSLYPGAFASYQGIVFRVTGPESSIFRGVSADLSASISVNQKLADESGKLLLSKAVAKLLRQLKEESGRSFSAWDKVNILVPNKIDLRFDDTLDMVYCSDPSCGTLDKLKYFPFPPKDRMPTCRRCKKSPVHQAPVWIPQKLPKVRSHVLVGDPGTGIIRSMGTAQVFCYFSRPGDKCNHPKSPDHACVHDFVQKLGALKIEDPQRPVDSLRRYNPHCPKGLDVPPIKLERLYRTGRYWYKMDFPRESMSVPLQVSAVESYSQPNDNGIDEINEVLDNMRPLIFNSKIVDLEGSKFSRMRVLEMTYGYRIGNSVTGVSSYYVGDGNDNVLGRLTETQGFMLKLRPEFHDFIEGLKAASKEGEDVERLKEIAAHSIKHALLVLAPLYTGFEPEKFFGSYDVLKHDEGAKIYVYDTDEGGNGGFAALLRNRNNLFEMFRQIKHRLECRTRECGEACKQCLFIKNCGNVNRKLNRHLLLDMGIFLLD